MFRPIRSLICLWCEHYTIYLHHPPTHPPTSELIQDLIVISKTLSTFLIYNTSQKLPLTNSFEGGLGSFGVPTSKEKQSHHVNANMTGWKRDVKDYNIAEEKHGQVKHTNQPGVPDLNKGVCCTGCQKMGVHKRPSNITINIIVCSVRHDMYIHHRNRGKVWLQENIIGRSFL